MATNYQDLDTGYEPAAPELTLRDYMDALRRRRWLFAAVAAGLILAGLLVALLLPPVYRSSAVILIEQQEIPPELVRSTVTSFADQRIQVISQRVMTSTNLRAIIERYGLYRDDLERDPIEVVLERMREDIELEMVSADVVDPRSGRPTQATIAFQLSYENENPQLAQRVTNELTTLYLNENLKNRTEMATETTSFLAAEANKLAATVNELEAELADFKEQHLGRLPEQADLNLQILERTEREIRDMEARIRALEERRIYLQAELAQTSPQSTLFGESGQRILSPRDRLRELETNLRTLRARYAAEHPEVVRAAKEVEALRAELGIRGAAPATDRLAQARAELATARERYAADHPDVRRLEREVASLETAEAATPAPADPMENADNPVYIQLRGQLEAANAELASLQGALAELRARRTDLESRLSTTPAVERDYRRLMRDYENAVAKYQEVRAKELEAQMSSALEEGRKGERFTLIEPPLQPEEPVKPNRLAIGFLALVFGLAGGLGATAVAESLDSAVHGPRDVARLLNATPLAAIPLIENRADARRALMRKLGFIGAVAGVGVLVVLLFHWLVVPIDVAWLVLMRRLGL